ncbi:HAD family hydrolase [Oricola sp.]|uniref:HAD family hydrolase n=1 Tax=Oricola sp. TaxID=1979950 RepID=UPI003BAC5AA0
MIFDCDGVLVDSEGPMHEVLCADLQERGLDITPEECLAQFMGKSIEGVVDTARQLGAVLPLGWKQQLYAKVHARLEAGVDLVPGVREFVETLRERGIPFCVASNGSEAKIELMLSQHGLWDAFRDACFSAQQVGIAKPEPGLLRHAITAMGGAANPVVIEDSPVGLQAAAAAGLPCIMLGSHVPVGADYAQVPVFSQMDSLADHILSLAD